MASRKRPSQRSTKKAARSSSKNLKINWFRIEHGPDFLQRYGPVFRATFTISDALREKYEAEERPIPDPVDGLMLLDTGAQTTSISSKAADALGLQPARVCTSHGADGKHTANMYYTRLWIRLTDGKRQTVLGWNLEVRGIPDLHEYLRIGPPDGKKVEVIGLLGRDILRKAKVTYDGDGGYFKVRFNLDTPSERPTEKT